MVVSACRMGLFCHHGECLSSTRHAHGSSQSLSSNWQPDVSNIVSRHPSRAISWATSQFSQDMAMPIGAVNVKTVTLSLHWGKEHIVNKFFWSSNKSRVAGSPVPVRLHIKSLINLMSSCTIRFQRLHASKVPPRLVQCKSKLPCRVPRWGTEIVQGQSATRADSYFPTTMLRKVSEAVFTVIVSHWRLWLVWNSVLFVFQVSLQQRMWCNSNANLHQLELRLWPTSQALTWGKVIFEFCMGKRVFNFAVLWS